MDIDKISQQIMYLANLIETYIKQLQTINSGLEIDDINDNSINFKKTITPYDFKQVVNNVDNARVLLKKITDNTTEINRLLAGAQLPSDYFDDSVTLAQYRAKNTLALIPDVAQHSSSLYLQVEYMNIGFKIWVKPAVKLYVALSGTGDNSSYFDEYYLDLNDGETIDIGQSKLFSQNITMPDNIGTYNLLTSMAVGTELFDYKIQRQIYIA
jgi:hypothetical protein